MKKVITIISLIVLISGCTTSKDSAELTGRTVTSQSEQSQQVVCNEPYIQFGISCCLDQNDNAICDKDETQNTVDLSQSKPACIPKWNCLSWSECGSSGTQTRTCTDENSCEITADKPAESQTCTPPETISIYSMNENIPVDYLTYQVVKVETFTEMGSSFLNKVTEGKFVKVYLKITNNAKETKQLFTPRFKIEDNQERKYDRVSDDMFYISDYLAFGEQLQPGLAKSGAIVFEMPKDSTDLKLIISGDWLSSSEVRVSLSDAIDISKDTTQEEELDSMMDEAMIKGEEMVEDLMNKCLAPFSCTTSCPQYMDLGQKDCPAGQLCCIQ